MIWDHKLKRKEKRRKIKSAADDDKGTRRDSFKEQKKQKTLSLNRTWPGSRANRLMVITARDLHQIFVDREKDRDGDQVTQGIRRSTVKTGSNFWRRHEGLNTYFGIQGRGRKALGGIYPSKIRGRERLSKKLFWNILRILIYWV